MDKSLAVHMSVCPFTFVQSTGCKFSDIFTKINKCDMFWRKDERYMKWIRSGHFYDPSAYNVLSWRSRYAKEMCNFYHSLIKIFEKESFGTGMCVK